MWRSKTLCRFVAGYAAANDITARWWQKHGSRQFVRGKSFDSFCPIGPWRSAEEVPDPQALRIVTTLNGDVVQDGATADMIFSVRDIIAHLSQDTTLPAGTVLYDRARLPGWGPEKHRPAFCGAAIRLRCRLRAWARFAIRCGLSLRPRPASS